MYQSDLRYLSLSRETGIHTLSGRGIAEVHFVVPGLLMDGYATVDEASFGL